MFSSGFLNIGGILKIYYFSFMNNLVKTIKITKDINTEKLF